MSSNETAEAILIVIKRLAWWIFLLFVGIVALISVIAGVYWGLDTWSRRATEVKTLGGITLGDKIDDVFFRLGKFERSGSLPDFYRNEEKRTAFSVKNGRVNTVLYFCRSSGDYTEVNDHRCGSNGDDILKRFGRDLRILCYKDNGKDDTHHRVYDTIKYGVRYQLGQNQVVVFIISDKHELQEMQGETWVPCP